MNNNHTVVEGRNITKEYRMGDMVIRVLNGISIQITQGEFVSIMGPSGSGKSTLLYILGGLDDPTGGRVFMGGKTFRIITIIKKVSCGAEESVLCSSFTT